MKRYEELTLTDDFMFSKVFEDESLCTELIEILLDVKVEKIEYLCKEKTFKEDYTARGIRLDVYIQNSDRVFDIEIQTTNKHDLPKRSRYYQALMDIESLSSGANFNDLKESYVIFICTFDPFGRGLAKYVFTEHSEELDDLYLNDKTWKVFYNTNEFTKIKNKNAQDFLQYLTTKTAKSEFTQKLEKAVYKARGHQDWRKEYMTVAMKFEEFLEDGRKQGIEIGLAEGRAEGRKQGLAEGRAKGLSEGRKEGIANTKLETARIALQNNLPMEMIIKLTGLTEAEIQKVNESLEMV